MRLEPYADGRLNDELTFPTNGAATVMPFTLFNSHILSSSG